MEQMGSWVAIAVGVVFPILGWIFNTLITNKIDASNKRTDAVELKQESDKALLFKKYDELKDQYVRKDLYDQAMIFHQKETDTKFNNLIETMNSNFKGVEADIKEVKDLINEKFKKNGG